MALSAEETVEFNTEASEWLDVAEKSLLALEEGAPLDLHFDAIFRTFHNLKGAAGMWELTVLESHMHQLETIFVGCKGQAALGRELVDLFLRGIDPTKRLLRGDELHFDYTKPGATGTAEAEETSSPTALPAFSSMSPPMSLATPPRAATLPPDQSARAILLADGLPDFLAECDEILPRLSANFEACEKNPHAELINSIYRDIHSMKGSSQLFGFRQLGDLLHAMESCLDPVRQGDLAFSDAILECLFRCSDVIERMLSAIRAHQPLRFECEVDSLLSHLSGLTAPPPELSALAAAPPALAAADLSSNALAALTGAAGTGAAGPAGANFIHGGYGDGDADKDSAHSIRVPVPLLDRLMTLMGEMVLVRNQVLQFASRSDDLEFLNLGQRLNVVTSEIQAEMMKTRMQPIGNIMNKFSRVVRDLAKDLGKKVELQLIGTETELDKTLLEAVKDPLTHIIRNSCDHGIETTDERRKAGKPECGTICVRSYHEGGQVIVEVKDDGKGLHREKLIAKAVEKGLITPEKAGGMTDREAFQLIFAPGFSTAAQVTNVSGRGVGMDVVRSNIDKIGGVVELASENGRGTTIRLKIPLTLAIVPAMIVRCDDDRYAIPQVKLVELVRVETGASENQIEFLQGKPVYRLRGNLLPLIDLKGALRFPNAGLETESPVINIVVVNAERQLFGLIVDEILDTADIVVKPLNRCLKSLAIYSGATVLGDGSVALILDVLGIAQQQLLLSERKGASAPQAVSSLDGRIRSDDAQEFLLFRINAPAKYAIVLSYVHRLEEFKRTAIEVSGEQRVVRYRDSMLPLVCLNRFLNFEATSASESDVVSVIVCERGDQVYGFEVDEILDVFSTELVMERGLSDRAGILGNLVTETEIIVIVDPARILTDVAAGLDKTKQAVVAIPVAPHSIVPQVIGHQGRSLNILFAEDMAFFRKQVASLLQQAGHSVTFARDGREALTKIEGAKRADFDLVLTDIEMPAMNGFELAQAIRADFTWRDVPLVALTTKRDRRSLDEGRRVGFTLFLEKLNPDELLAALDHAVTGQRGAA